eukprot:scaffold137148_cov20-Tisochrysis_lutea.AAC.3
MDGCGWGPVRAGRCNCRLPSLPNSSPAWTFPWKELRSMGACLRPPAQAVGGARLPQVPVAPQAPESHHSHEDSDLEESEEDEVRLWRVLSMWKGC